MAGKEIKSVQTRIYGLWEQIPSVYKLSFFTTFAIGFFANLFAFSNNLINADTINEGYQNLGLGYLLNQGRWLQHAVRVIGNLYPSPVIHGMFSLIALSLTAAMTCAIFHLSDQLYVVLLSALMGMFPINVCYLSYIFSAEVFFVSLFFAVLAVLLVERGGLKNFFAASLALMCSVAVYQAFISITVAYIVALYFFRLLQTERFDLRKWFFSALRDTLMVVVGYVLYGVVTKILLYVTGTSLRGYSGTDQSFSISLEDIPLSIQITLADIKTFYFSTIWIPHKLFVIANLLIAALFAIVMVWTVYRYVREKRFGVMLICIAYDLVLPFLIDNIYLLMNVRGSVHMLMHYDYIVPYMMLLILLPQLFSMLGSRREQISAFLKRCANSLTALGTACSILILYFCFLISNQLYCRMSNNMTATNANLTSMLAQIESVEGWDLDTPVYIANARSVLNSNLYADQDFYSEIGSQLWTGTDVYAWGNSGQIYLYLARYFNTLLTLPSEEQTLAVVASEEYAQMPVFPAEGSVQLIQDVVVVKMEE